MTSDYFKWRWRYRARVSAISSEAEQVTDRALDGAVYGQLRLSRILRLRQPRRMTFRVAILMGTRGLLGDGTDTVDAEIALPLSVGIGV